MKQQSGRMQLKNSALCRTILDSMTFWVLMVEGI